MKQFNLCYNNHSELKSFVEKNSIHLANQVLVQVFSGICEHNYLTQTLAQIHAVLPQAIIIGATTAGEIIDGEVNFSSCVLAISVFEHSHVTCLSLDESQLAQFEANKCLDFIQKDTKALIILASGLSLNHISFINKIPNQQKQFVVCGGLAGDNDKLIQTWAYSNEKIIANGMVLVALSGKQLKAKAIRKFNWTPIGRELEVSKAKDNIIYQLDGHSLKDCYAHYLGEQIAYNLPNAASFYPLTQNKNGLLVSRIMMQVNPDGSGVFTGNFKAGDRLRFAYADMGMLLNNDYLHPIEQDSIEAMFVFSCGGRKHLLGDEIVKDVLPLTAISPHAGFFSYGEIFSGANGQCEILNNTMAILALSENNKKLIVQPEKNTTQIEKTHSNLLQSLTHFTDVVTQELVESRTQLALKNQKLNQQIKQLQDKEEELIKANQIIAKAHREKSKFLAAASHDLRQPIHAMGFQLEQIKQSHSNTTLANDIKALSDCHYVLSSSIDNLLDLSRLESGNVQITRSHFALQDLFDTLEVELKPQALEKGIKLKFRPSPEYIYSDYERLRQIFSNLVGNAIKFTFQGGVLVGARVRGEKLSLEVWDTGIGIPANQHQSIFKQYVSLEQQQPKNTLSQQKGMGIGLSIVEHIASLLKLSLSLKSKEQLGSVFKLQVAKGVSDNKPNTRVQQSNIMSFQGSLILLIDDDYQVLQTTSKLLRSWQCATIEAQTISEALELSEEEEISLILSDYKLENGENGIEAVRQINQSLEKPAPAIIITGETSAQSLSKIQRAGLQLLKKPVSPAILRNIIAQNLFS